MFTLQAQSSEAGERLVTKERLQLASFLRKVELVLCSDWL